jgi:hypothetical protein
VASAGVATVSAFAPASASAFAAAFGSVSGAAVGTPGDLAIVGARGGVHSTGANRFCLDIYAGGGSGLVSQNIGPHLARPVLALGV